jgi:hypothetical protein
MIYKGFEIYVEYNTYEIFRLTDNGDVGDFVDSESDGTLRGYSAGNGEVALYGTSLDELKLDIDGFLENLFNPQEKVK